MSSILFFIPTLNEEKNISHIVNEIFNFYQDIDVLIIDDNSTDSTIQVLQNLQINNLQVIVRRNESGIGSAHIHALKYASERNYKFLITLDGDGTHKVSDAQQILNVLENFDLVIGSRFLNSYNFVGWTKTRKILSKLGHFVTEFGFGVRFDLASGYRGYNLSRSNLQSVLMKINGNSYDFFPSSVATFVRHGLKISEVPIIAENRKSGKSKMSFQLMISSVFRLFGLIFKFKTRNFYKSKI